MFPAPIPRPIPAYDNIWKKEAIFSVTPMAAGAASVGGETKIQAILIIRSPSLFFLMNILGKQSDLPFSRKSDRKKEKSMVSFTHEQNIICSQTLLDGIACEQTIICRQLFAGHVVGSPPMKRKKNLFGIIIIIIKQYTVIW